MLIRDGDLSDPPSENVDVQKISEDIRDLKLFKEEDRFSGEISQCLPQQINGNNIGSALCFLNLSNQKLSTFQLPDGHLVNVTHVDLSHNTLSDLPESFKLLCNIRKLNLSFNSFEVVPECLYSGLSFVKYLDLSHNRLIDFLRHPLCLPFLNYLNVSFNYLKSPPLWLLDPDDRKSKYLDTVDLSSNPCLSMKLDEKYNPHTWRKVADNVNTLILSNTGLTVKNAPFLKNFRNVKKLILSNATKKNISNGNILSEWPSTWWDLTVNEVELAGCWMGDLENLVTRLPTVSSLDLSHNELCWLSNSFSSLHQLTSLRASSVALIFLPNDFGLLRSLKHLHLPHNSIRTLPESFYDLEDLETLDLYNNNLSVTPNIDCFKKLTGFDVSLNCCSTSEINGYEYLKKKLRLVIPNGMDRCDKQKIPQEVVYSDDGEHFDSDEDDKDLYESESNEDENVYKADEMEFPLAKCSEEEYWLDGDSSNVVEEDDDYDEKGVVEETEEDIIKRAEAKYLMHFYLPYQQPPQFFGTEQNFWTTAGRFHVPGQFNDA